MVLGEESLADSLLDDDFHELGVVLKFSLGDVLESVEDLLDFVLEDLAELSVRDTISVEDDGFGVSLVDSVIVSQSSFNEGSDLVHNFDLFSLGLLNE